MGTINPFSFTGMPKIVFGAGKSKELPSIINQYGKNIILVTGKDSFKRSEEGNKILEAFVENGINITPVEIMTEPSPLTIDNVVSSYKNKLIDVVVAIGGGSVMDAGQAISAMLLDENSVEEYLEGVGKSAHSGKKIPMIAVPTTAGTGSEATKNAVLSKIGPNGYKASLRHEHFVPDVAVVDPVLTLTSPQTVTAYSGMDCFSQLVEAYISTKANPFTDALAQEGLKAVKASLETCYNDGSNLEARTQMSFAALISGICLSNAGLGVVHGFASSIGSRYNIPHGAICGTLMAVVNETNVRKLKKMPYCKNYLAKYARLGLLFAGKKDNATMEDYADAFVDYLFALTDKLKLPKFVSYGVADEDIPQILKKTSCKNNPILLSPLDLKEIFQKRNK